MSKIEDREAEVGFFWVVLFFFPILYAEEKKKAHKIQPTNQPTNKPEPHVMVVVKNCLKGMCLKSQQSKAMSKVLCFSYETYMQESLGT